MCTSMPFSHPLCLGTTPHPLEIPIMTDGLTPLLHILTRAVASVRGCCEDSVTSQTSVNPPKHLLLCSKACFVTYG